MNSVSIGLVGCGTVGASVAERLLSSADTIRRRTGVDCTLRAIAIKDPSKRRPATIAQQLFSDDALRTIEDPRVDVVVECVGGTGEAGEIVERALDRGLHVVTANKELIAGHGPRLQQLAVARGVSLRFEAAVGGAMPIVRVLDDALAGDEVRAIYGVLNGTSTAILSAMEAGATYEKALRDAQARGYAEADPSSDVDGADAAHKLAILIQRAFRLAVLSLRVPRRGIAAITAEQVALARARELRFRLLAAAKRTRDGVAADVAPVLVPIEHPFAQTRGPENAARVLCELAGTIDVRGNGAGGTATASAVLADVVALVRAIAERHDFRQRRRWAPMQAAQSVRGFFDELPPSGIGTYRQWSEACVADELLAGLVPA